MKKVLRFIVPLMIVVLLVSACAPAQTEAPAAEDLPAVEDPATEEAPVETEEAQPAETEEAAPTEETEAASGPTDDDMEALIIEKADGNHMLDFILGQDKTREEWETTLDRMIGYGAKISPEEKELIIDWLLSR